MGISFEQPSDDVPRQHTLQVDARHSFCCEQTFTTAG